MPTAWPIVAFSSAPPHSLPHTSSGKLSRAGTRANYLAGAYSPAHRDAGLKLAAEG